MVVQYHNHVPAQSVWHGSRGFFIHRFAQMTQFFGGVQKHCSAVSREGAKTRRLEGECPREPPSALCAELAFRSFLLEVES